MKPWWAFTLPDVIVITVTLVVIYSFIGAPHGLWWLWLPVGIMLGRWLSTRIWR